ncbi:MAG: cell division protein FtsL [Oleiphilaceae bacterium]|jgi:cell division protein FtsL
MIKIKMLLPLYSMLLKQGRNELNLKRIQSTESVFLDKLYEFVENLNQIKAHVSIKGVVVTLMLALIVVLSAIGVVQSSHLSRQLFAEKSILLDRNDQLQLEWAQLLLEQSAWSLPNRLENVASKKLGMHMPKAEDIQLIY